MALFGKSTVEKEIGSLQDKLEQLRGTRAQFAQRHVEAVASRREFLDRGTPDIAALDKISARIAGLESSLTACDQSIEFTGAALANAVARRDAEAAAKAREDRATRTESNIPIITDAHSRLEVPLASLIGALRAADEPEAMQAAMLLEDVRGQIDRAVPAIANILKSRASRERVPPVVAPPMPKTAPKSELRPQPWRAGELVEPRRV
jgi:hypothetical protein